MSGPEDHATLEELIDQLLAHARSVDEGTEWQLTLRPETYALLSGTRAGVMPDGPLGSRFRATYQDTELWIVDLLGDVIVASALSMPGRPTAPLFYLDLADPTRRVRNNDVEPLVEHLRGT